MKIIEVPVESNGNTLIEIDDVKYIGNFAIKIKFHDGVEKLVDFKPFLCKSLHPSIKKYLNKEQFTKFQIVDGNLNWNDYDLIFPVADLYEGSIN